MNMNKSFYELINAEDEYMRSINRYEDAINIYVEEKRRSTEREMYKISDSEYLKDMARYDRMINEAETRKNECEDNLRKIRLQIHDYIKNIYGIS